MVTKLRFPAFVLACALVVQPAAAQSAAARAEFEEGVALMQTGRFAEAAQRLSASLAHAPRTATAFNLAVSLRGTGDVLGALDRFERVLAGDYGKVSATERKQVQALVKETEAEVSVLGVRIANRIAGAELRLDGALVPLGEQEVVTVRVNPGTRQLTYVAPDYTSIDERVVLARGERRTVAVVPRRADDRREGVLQLETSDPRAVLYVEGHRSGPSPLVQRLPPGSYRVTIRLGSNERTTLLTVPAGRNVRLVLEPPTGRSVLTSPWFWGSVGLAVVAGSVTAVLLATQTVERDPQKDPYWGAVQVLRY